MQPTTKKPRRPAHVWKRFFRLGSTQLFYVGKEVWQREGFFSARPIRALNNARFFRWPWTRVRTLELVKQPAQPVQSSRASGVQMTHYVGDDCIPPHPSFEQTGPSA